MRISTLRMALLLAAVSLAGCLGGGGGGSSGGSTAPAPQSSTTPAAQQSTTAQTASTPPRGGDLNACTQTRSSCNTDCFVNGNAQSCRNACNADFYACQERVLGAQTAALVNS
jgi:hypothetical protein